jgi:hypothetical protein
MDHWSDRRSPNPITLQVQHETAARMRILHAYCHQGWSTAAHDQAGYRRAVRPELTISSSNLAPPAGGVHIDR